MQEDQLPVATQQLPILESYQYHPIVAENTVRILTLYPGEKDDDLAGELELVNLDENPKYEAISYVWGDPTRCFKMTCNGKILWLTQSLGDGLKRIRHEHHPRRLWADQICINQENAEERGQQVKMMNLIYKSTAKVLVWLGTDDRGVAREAFDMVMALDAVFEDEDLFSQFTEEQREKLDEISAEVWQPLTDLYHRPWVSTLYKPSCC